MAQRSRNLANIFVSSRSQPFEHHLLTPRTPHSRSGRAEEGHTPGDDDDWNNDDDSVVSSLSSRLLVPSELSSAPLGYRSRGDDYDIFSHGAPSWPQVMGLVRRFFFIAACFMACGVLALFMAALRDLIFDRVGGSAAEFIPSERLILYANYTRFPLTGPQYRHECEKLEQFKNSPGYWDAPQRGPLDVYHTSDVVYEEQTNVCSRSITYLLDGHVGLATDLALMAQVAGLARERKIPFFVDDTHWIRGKWSDYFQNVKALHGGPSQDCLAPPSNELVACPRSARHWVISSQTASFHFGDEIMKTLKDEWSHHKALYHRAFRSLTDIIHPNAHTMDLIKAARAEITSILSLSNESLPGRHPDPYIGVHIPIGNQDTSSGTHNQSVISVDKFVQSARDTWSRIHPATVSSSASSLSASEAKHAEFPSPPIAYMATDSPEALRSYMSAFPSSTAIFGLDLSTNPELRALAPQHGRDQEHIVHDTPEERISLTRGMVVDLALLSGLWADERDIVPGATVCTVSSDMCKLAAIGLGWDRAFGADNPSEDSRWVDVSADSANSKSTWRAFEIPA